MARTKLPNGVILPAEYSDDWYGDMTSNLTKLDDVIGSDSEKLNSNDVAFLRMSSAALTDGGTGNFSDLNYSNKLKTGDCVLDSGRKLYQIVSVDSTNETFTVGNSIFKVTAESDLAPVAESGDYDDLDNKPNLKPVATSGDYDDLTDLPTYGITRFCSSAITDNSSVAFSAISSTNKIKVGDFLLDTVGKMYQISSVDTANETVSVTTPLTQLAIDSDVVHKSGNETIAGVKTFSDNPLVGNANTNITISNRQIIANGLASTTGNHAYSYVRFQAQVNYADSSSPINATVGLDINEDAYTDGKRSSLSPNSNNLTNLGKPGKRWANVYATNYYYGGSEIEFSQKFVTTDTAQTISGNKNFNGNTNCVGELNQTAPFKMTADTSFVIGSKNTSIYDQNGFQCSNDLISYNNSKNIRRTWTVNNNGSGTTVTAGFNFILSASGTKVFYPITDNDTDNGSTTAYWKNTYTKRVNGVEPSSLSLPSGNANDVIDISSYLVNLDGTDNTYVAPSNGWITINMNNCSGIHATIAGFWGDSRVRASAGAIKFLMPVLKNQTVTLTIHGGTIDNARFIPCQGNV